MDDSLSQDEIDALLNAMPSEQSPASSDADAASQPFLSQNEINTLMNTVTSPQTPYASGAPAISSAGIASSQDKDINVDKYDFTMPSRVSRDHLRSLRTLHNSYAQSLSSSLSITMRSVVEVTCVHIEQLVYGEYLSSLVDPSCLGVFSLAPLKGFGVIEMNPLLVFPIIDRLLGGSGASRFYNRTFTAIEEMVITQVMENALDILKSAWRRNMQLDIKLERMENNPQFIQAAATSDPVILILFDVIMEDIHSMMSLCVPFLTIQQALASLRREDYPAHLDEETTTSYREMMHVHMSDMNVTMSARYETSQVTVRDLLELQKGDIIRLPNTDKDKAEVLIGGQMKFSAKPGMSSGRRAVQIYGMGKESKLRKTNMAETNNADQS